jgi:hypothetical protein
MSGLHRATAICFLGTGVLLTAFGLFSLLGTLTGGVMTIAGLAGGDAEVGGIGAVVLLFYAVWMVACLGGGPLQVGAGVRLMRGAAPEGALHWLATAAGLVSCVTVYCALPGILSFALGLASALTPAPAETTAIAPGS